jgi:cell division protein FtsQ
MTRRGRASRAGLPARAAAGISAPADKRFRRSDVRPARRRATLLIGRMGKVAAGVSLAVAAVAAVAGALLTAPSLAVDRIDVGGHARLSAADVEALLDGLRGRNIFRVDLEAFRARVMTSPWVDSATLWRVLPSTIEVRVVERQPMVLARLGHLLYLMDDQGVIIDEFGPGYAAFDLPIADGLGSPAGRGGPRVDMARVRLAGQFLAALDARPDLRQRVSQLNVSNARDVVVLLEDDAALLHLGDTDFAERLEFYLELLPTLGDQFRDIDYVDLRFGRQVVVKDRGQPAAAPVAKAGRRR